MKNGFVLGDVKTEIIKVEKSVEITEKDVVAEAKEIKKERNNDKREEISRNSQEQQEKETENQNEAISFLSDAEETLLMNFLSEAESGELANDETTIEPDRYVRSSDFTISETVRWQCNYCKITKESSSLIRKHIRREHKNENLSFKYTNKHKNEVKNFECYTCEKKFVRKSSLKRHTRIHMGIVRSSRPLKVKNFKCYTCETKFSRKDSLKRHTTRDMCSSFMRSFPLKVTNFECYTCEQKFNKKSNLERHIRNIHMSIRQLLPLNLVHRCPHCPKIYRKTDLQLHIKSKHCPRDKQLKCTDCSYRTHRLKYLKNHKLTHLKPEEIQYCYCYHCNFKTKKRDWLPRHISLHFKKEEVKFECYICDFSTMKRQIIVDHISEHGNKKQNM